jgi:5-methylcytosine-specific restriction endonuclease McrA
VNRIRIPCLTPHCPGYAVKDGRCLDHQRLASSTARGYGSGWQRLRLRILARDPYCTEPGCTAPSTTVDHIVSRRMGGTDDEHNLRGVCASCNARKSVYVEGALGLRKTKRIKHALRLMPVSLHACNIPRFGGGA